MENRKQLLTLCHHYRSLKLSTIDLRSSGAQLYAELVRIGHYQRTSESIPDHLLYSVYPRLPLSVLLRLYNRKLITDQMFWSRRLELALPPALVPKWIVDVKRYDLLQRGELVGRLHLIGGSYGAEWIGASEELVPFLPFDQPIRLLSDSGPFRFVGLDGELYQFRKGAFTTTIDKIEQPHKGVLRKIVGRLTSSPCSCTAMARCTPRDTSIY